jgi:hypothetical protein
VNRYLTEQATRHFNPSDDSFEQILLDVMNFEPYEAVMKSWELLRWWFAAHLTDLLSHAGLVEDIQLEYVSPCLFPHRHGRVTVCAPLTIYRTQ